MIRNGGRKSDEVRNQEEKELLDKCDGLATAAGRRGSNGGENVNNNRDRNTITAAASMY